jgi:hypothetical protein
VIRDYFFANGIPVYLRAARLCGDAHLAKFKQRAAKPKISWKSAGPVAEAKPEAF